MFHPNGLTDIMIIPSIASTVKTPHKVKRAFRFVMTAVYRSGQITEKKRSKLRSSKHPAGKPAVKHMKTPNILHETSPKGQSPTMMEGSDGKSKMP